MSIFSLPDEILEQIFKMLFDDDVANVSVVCRRFYAIINRENVWLERCNTKLGKDTLEKEGNGVTNWREFYQLHLFRFTRGQCGHLVEYIDMHTVRCRASAGGTYDTVGFEALAEPPFSSGTHSFMCQLLARKRYICSYGICRADIDVSKESTGLPKAGVWSFHSDAEFRSLKTGIISYGRGYDQGDCLCVAPKAHYLPCLRWS